MGALATISVAAQGDVAREDTVIFDIDQSDIPNPINFNPLVPGTNRNQGAHQAMWEPLFILNYETGKIQPWLADSFDHNDAQDVWTLKLKKGATWSDGVPFTTDDVDFTINMLLNDKTVTLGNAGDMQQCQERQEDRRPDRRIRPEGSGSSLPTGLFLGSYLGQPHDSAEACLGRPGSLHLHVL